MRVPVGALAGPADPVFQVSGEGPDPSRAPEPADQALTASGDLMGPGSPSVAGAAASGPAVFPGPPSPRRASGRARQRRQAAAPDSPLYALKMEAATELGLLDKVRDLGWGGLSAAEAGRIGGYVTRALRERAGPPSGGGPPPPGHGDPARV